MIALGIVFCGSLTSPPIYETLPQPSYDQNAPVTAAAIAVISPHPDKPIPSAVTPDQFTVEPISEPTIKATTRTEMMAITFAVVEIVWSLAPTLTPLILTYVKSTIIEPPTSLAPISAKGNISPSSGICIGSCSHSAERCGRATNSPK